VFQQGGEFLPSARPKALTHLLVVLRIAARSLNQAVKVAFLLKHLALAAKLRHVVLDYRELG
jgi:hypothetical protein